VRSRSSPSTQTAAWRSSGSRESRRGNACSNSRQGTREPDEEALETAKRELEEEAGLVGGDWRLAATFFSTPGFCDELVDVYIAEGVERTQRAPEDDEEIELVRVPVAELESRLVEIEDAKTLAGLLLYLRER